MQLISRFTSKFVRLTSRLTSMFLPETVQNYHQPLHYPFDRMLFPTTRVCSLFIIQVRGIKVITQNKENVNRTQKILPLSFQFSEVFIKTREEYLQLKKGTVTSIYRMSVCLYQHKYATKQNLISLPLLALYFVICKIHL